MTDLGSTLATLDPDEERNILNILPSGVSDKIRSAIERRPDLFKLDEHSLAKALRAEQAMLTPTDHRLRMKFWFEYDEAQANTRRMKIANVIAGVCLNDYFHTSYLHHPEKVAWLVCPPASYLITMEEGLQFGLQQLREVLELPIHDPLTGKLDHKLVEIKAKITNMMDMRVKGGIVQKLEQKNLHLHASTKDVQNLGVEGTMEQLDKRIKQLEALERKALNLPTGKQVIDVDST